MNAKPAGLETIEVGDIRVTYVPDGSATMSAQAAFPQANDTLWEAHRELFNDEGLLQLTLGGFLVETGDRKILVDLGFGDIQVKVEAVGGGFDGGQFLRNLEKVGVRPADVDTVFYTHMHLDHVGWTSVDGELVYPNARYVAGENEYEFWAGVTDENLLAIGPDPESVQAPLQGRIETAGNGETIAPGVNVMATPGHTPGHSSLVISSGSARAIILGDVLHCPLQVSEPELGLAADVDPNLASKTREQINAELESDSNITAATMHFPNSVFGRVLRGKGREWVGL
jgi:glyoxylase-like metal-dependent hydrolase (beta-lactamase superfamily II)